MLGNAVCQSEGGFGLAFAGGCFDDGKTGLLQDFLWDFVYGLLQWAGRCTVWK